ncbi:S8 family serine peptidase [Pseudonocardia halophobica]|uniref:Peptidase S8/S53 domain-containing protein n=1 Tax=Pseudonocardia halophobica TaxID=29401 RepID=A0A9W6NU68_9PSEU|nr:hypothetical protein GCM10017577_04230 [Pseudonocardia halophobica]
MVANAALRLLGRYPSLTANAVRALLLASVTESDRVVDLGQMAKSLEAQRRLTGYGRLDVDRAVSSTSHRVVMLSESAIKVDDVHIYSVAMPGSFFESGGVRTICMALAYDPPVRPTRLDYLANRMSVNLFYRASQDLVLSEFVKNPPTVESSNEEADGDVPRALASYRIPLLPPDTARSRGTNHFGRFERKIRYDRSEGEEIVVAVRNINRWDTPGAQQDYALVITLERDDEHAPIYAEARAQLPALLDVEVETEV